MTLPLLSSPDAVVLGTNTMDATAAFLEGLGFTETGRTVLTEEAAESLYGLGGGAEERTFAVRDASGQALGNPGQLRRAGYPDACRANRDAFTAGCPGQR